MSSAHNVHSHVWQRLGRNVNLLMVKSVSLKCHVLMMLLIFFKEKEKNEEERQIINNSWFTSFRAHPPPPPPSILIKSSCKTGGGGGGGGVSLAKSPFTWKKKKMKGQVSQNNGLEGLEGSHSVRGSVQCTFYLASVLS